MENTSEVKGGSTSVTAAHSKNETEQTGSESKATLDINKTSSSSSSSAISKKELGSQKKSKAAQSDVQNTFDACVFGKTKLWLPHDMKSNPAVFHEVVSMTTWEDCLTSEERTVLSNLLPTFTENNDEEQKETLRQLFEGENFRFGNPLKQFEQDLSMHRFGVESVEKQRAWQRLQREEYQLQNSHRLQTMLPEVLIKRQELLEVVQFTSPSEYIKKPQQTIKRSKLDNRETEKYVKLLEDLNQEFGESMLSGEEAENGIYSDEEDVLQLPWEDRLHKFFDSPSKTPHCTLTHKTTSSEVNDKDSHMPVTCPANIQTNTEEEEKPPIPEVSLVTEKDYMKMLERMQIMKEDCIEHPEFIFSHITLRDIINRTYPVKIRSQEEANAEKRKRKKEKEEIKSKKKKKTPTSSPKPLTPVSLVNSQDSLAGPEVPSSPESIPTSVQQEPVPTPIKQEETQPPATTVLPQASPEVYNKVQYQVPHSFFALLRKYFNVAMNHQLWVSDLEERVSIWEKSPVSARCPWRPLQSTWSKVVENTLYFLSLEEQGKLVRYLEEEDAWIWPDPMSTLNNHLTMLFKRWLDLILRVQPEPPPMPCKDGTLVIPEPRMYTDYTVRGSSEEDIHQFRNQELQRFSEPQKPFTYCQHGYEAVVGPVKGITPMDPLPASKGREHSLLISDRPSYVTILSLVRDAVARLPNGEGTKVEICHLLKSSQFIAPGDTEASLLAAASGALDRLHNENDPSVKFDATRKLWVYLHRNRSVKDFERIQREQMLASRTKKSSSKPKQGTQLRVPSLDTSGDLTASSSESSSPSFDLSNRSSPRNASLSPRVLSFSPRSAVIGIDQPEATEQPQLMVTGKVTTSSSERSSIGITADVPHPDANIDPNITTIQSLISESLIKSQLMKKPYQRSKTPPASLGRSNMSATLTLTKKSQLSSPGGVQRSMSIPASWPHIVQSAAGDLIPSDLLLSQCSRKPMARKDDSTRQDTTSGKKHDYGSKARANSPKGSGSGGERKSSAGGKSKSKGDKSKASKSSSEKKSPTVQLKSGAITVTLPSSALKGQTVRSILASAASITIGNTAAQLGQEQCHPTVQAVRKRLMAEKSYSSKTKQVKQMEVKVLGTTDNSEHGIHMQPLTVNPKRTAALPTIILRPTTSSFFGQTTAVSKDGTVPQTQISSQPLALMGMKPTGVVTSLASSQMSKQLPLSLVVSGACSKATPSVGKPQTSYIQHGNIPIPSIAPGQNIILQMPDGSKFVTSIPVSTVATVPPKIPAPTKMSRPGPVGVGGVTKASINVLQSTTIVTAHQNKQGKALTSPTGFHNPYEFDDDQEAPRAAIGKSYIVPSSVIKSPVQTNPVFAVTSNVSPVQRFALNLVTKPGSPGRKQGSVTQAGIVRGTLTPTGSHRGTIIQTAHLKGVALPTGISMGGVAQDSLLKGAGQTGIVRGAVSHSGVLKSTTMPQTGIVRTAVSQSGVLKRTISQTGIVRTAVSQSGVLKRTISQTGIGRGAVSHTGLLKGTTMSQTGIVKRVLKGTTGSQTGIVKRVISQSGMLKGTTVSQTGIVKQVVSHTGVLKGTTTSQPGIVKASVSQSGMLKGTTVSQTGIVKQVVSHTGVLKGTTTSQPGIVKGAVSQSTMFKGSINSQTRMVKTLVSQSGMMKGAAPLHRGNVKTVVAPPSSTVVAPPSSTVIAPPSSMEGMVSSQSGTLKDSALQSGAQQVTHTHTIVTTGDLVTSAPRRGTQGRTGSVIVKPISQDTSSLSIRSGGSSQVGERSRMIVEADRGPSEVTVERQTPASQINSVERIRSNTQATVRTGHTGNRSSSRSSAGVPAGRMSYRSHSSPGILRKPHDHSRKNRPAMRVTKSVSTITSIQQQQQAVRAEVRVSSSREDVNNPQDMSVTLGQTPARRTLIQPNKSYSETRRSQEDSSVTISTGSRIGSRLITGSKRGMMEGEAKTAKLIKSQELAEAVLGDMSKQGGQENT